MPSSRRSTTGNQSPLSRKHRAPASYQLAFTSDIADVGRLTEQNLHGGFKSITTGAALDSVPTDINLTTGQGKVVVVVNAGSDIDGSFTITGDTVDRDTGVVTSSDTETLTVDALTVDAADTDANGNTRHSITGGYITSKWFNGALTISTADLTLTDVDVYHLSYEQVNDTSAFTLTALDLNLGTNSALAEMDLYLYSVDVTGSTVAIARVASINLIDETADRLYRKRKGKIGRRLNGLTDGFFLDLFNGSANKIENLTMKIWVRVDGPGTDVLSFATPHEPSYVTLLAAGSAVAV